METREAIESRLADLHRQRGHALLHGEKFSNALIVEEHEKLAALQDLESAKIEQAREEATRARQEQITAVRTEIADLTAASTKALSDSRTAYHQGAQTMKTHLQTEASLRKAQVRLNALTGEKTPIQNVFELERKRSLQIASVGLKAINNHPSRFGNLSWPMSLIEWKD